MRWVEDIEREECDKKRKEGARWRERERERVGERFRKSGESGSEKHEEGTERSLRDDKIVGFFCMNALLSCPYSNKLSICVEFCRIKMT